MGTKGIETFETKNFVANLTFETQEKPPFVYHLWVLKKDGSRFKDSMYFEGKVVAHREFKAGETPNKKYINNILSKMEKDEDYLNKYRCEIKSGSGVW